MIKEHYWKNSSGELIKIKDMDNFYIENCIKLIKENPGWRDIKLEPLEFELKLRASRWKTTTLRRKSSK